MANRQNTAGPADVHEEQEYLETTDGEGLLGPDARVWRLLLDELGVHDAKSLQGLRDHLDADIVFTGLFAAVVTSFVVQSSQAIQPDHDEISTALLTELIAVQRAASNGWPVDEVPPSVLQMNSVTASVNDYWANRLWLLSLTLSLFAAFMAFVIRGWLHAYDEAVTGHVKRQAFVRQYRRIGFERWGVPSIIPILPLLLHTSLLLFFLGLIFYNCEPDPAMAKVLASLTALLYSLYVLSSAFPLRYPDCPYDSPVSYFGYLLLVRVQAWIWRVLRALPVRSGLLHSQPGARSDSPAWTFHSREMEAVTTHWDDLAKKNLAWALSRSTNPTLIRTAVRAVFSLFRRPVQASTHTEDEVAEGIAGRLRDMLGSPGMSLEWAIDQEEEVQHFAQNLLMLADDKGQDVDAYKGLIIHVINSITKLSSKNDRPLPPALEATVLALSDPLEEPPAPLQALFPFLFPRVKASAVSGSNERTYWVESSLAGPLSPMELKLDPLIWTHMIQYLAYASYFTSTQCLHFALFLWRNMDPTAQFQTGNKRQVKKEPVSLQWMYTAEGQGGFRRDVQRAIHRLLMCSKDSCDVYTGTRKEKHDTDGRDTTEDEAVWLHMSDRAIKAYSSLKDALPFYTSKANQNRIDFERLDQATTGLLAATFAHFLRPHNSIEFISTADKLVGLPGVSPDIHAQLASRFRQAADSLASKVAPPDDVKALFNFLVKLLKVCPATEDTAHNAHLDTVRTLGCLLKLYPAALYDAIVEHKINPFDILRPLTDVNVSDPSSGPLSQALASMLVPHVEHLVDGLRLSMRMSALQTVREVERTWFLVWCIWIDALSTTQNGQWAIKASQQQDAAQVQQAGGLQPAPSFATHIAPSNGTQPGHSVSWMQPGKQSGASDTAGPLHQALQTLIGLISPQSRAVWLNRMEEALEKPLPLAVAMALKEPRGYQALEELLYAMSDMRGLWHPQLAVVERILNNACIRVEVGSDGKISSPKRVYFVQPEQAYPNDTTTLPLSTLLSLQEYRRKMDATSPPESIAGSRTDVASMDMAASPHIREC